MRLVVQRVANAKVDVDGKTVGTVNIYIINKFLSVK